jgi:hypothetical protein
MLPDTIAEAARFHHEVERTIPSMITNKTLACIVGLANVVVQRLAIGPGDQASPAIDTLVCAQFLNCQPAMVESLGAKVRDAYEAQRGALA